MFTGTIRIKICEACGLRPTDFQKRHNMTFGKPDEQPIDPYVSIDVDENHLGKFPICVLRFSSFCGQFCAIGHFSIFILSRRSISVLHICYLPIHNKTRLSSIFFSFTIFPCSLIFAGNLNFQTKRQKSLDGIMASTENQIGFPFSIVAHLYGLASCRRQVFRSFFFVRIAFSQFSRCCFFLYRGRSH